MLALAYALQVEAMAAEYQTMVLAAAFGSLLGGQLERPDWGALMADFDGALNEPPGGTPAGDDSVRGIKVRALGVG